MDAAGAKDLRNGKIIFLNNLYNTYNKVYQINILLS